MAVDLTQVSPFHFTILAAEPEVPAVEIIGVDPNSGPTKEQWATVLNATVSIREYEHNLRTAIHAAVVGEHTAQTGLLLAAGVDVNIADEQQITPLHSALAQGLDKLVKDLLFIGGSKVDAVTMWGDSILKYAFVSPSSRKLRGLLRFHMEEHSDEPMEPIMGNSRFVTTFLENGADATSCDADGNYPMHWLINGTAINYRLDGVDLQLSNSNVFFGPDSNFVERAKQLLDFGFDDRINGCNKFGQTSLHLAFARGMTDVARLLLDSSANPNIVDSDGNLPLHVACVGWALGSEELVSRMLAAGDSKFLVQGVFDSADVARGLTKKEREENSLEKFMANTYTDVVVSPPSVIFPQIAKEKLIVLKNKLGFSPLHYVSGAGVATSEPLGLALGKCPFEGCEMQKPIDSEEELHKREAILSNRESILNRLLRNGGDANAIGANGLRPVHCIAMASASWHGDLDEKVMGMLKDAGAKLSVVDSQGRAGGGGARFSPLHYAIQAQQFELAWYLIRAGCEIHPATCNPPLLHIACEHGAPIEMIGYILTHGEDANIRGSGIYKGHRKYCGTALQLAAANGHDGIVCALLMNGPVHPVEVNVARPHNGRTALHLAAFHGHQNCVVHLIEDGNADPNLECGVGETALFSAIRGKNSASVKFLVEQCKSSLNLANGASAIPMAEAADQENPDEKDNQAIIECLLSTLSDDELAGMEHAHECYSARKSLGVFLAEKAAAEDSERKEAELARAQSMCEAIFELADTEGSGHLNCAALVALHDQVGSGTEMTEEHYVELSTSIGADVEHGWDPAHLLAAYLGEHPIFSLDRDHELLFPPAAPVTVSEEPVVPEDS